MYIKTIYNVQHYYSWNECIDFVFIVGSSLRDILVIILSVLGPHFVQSYLKLSKVCQHFVFCLKKTKGQGHMRKMLILLIPRSHMSHQGQSKKTSFFIFMSSIVSMHLLCYMSVESLNAIIK